MTQLDRIFSLRLRKDLEIHPAPADADGSDGWILHDPIQHRFFRIDASTHLLVELWLELDTLAAAVVAYCDETGLEVSQEQVLALARFAEAGNLSLGSALPSSGSLATPDAQSAFSSLRKLAHHYLFFKVPLFRPQAALEAALPLVRPLMRPAVGFVLLGMALLALYLISRQWDQFWHGMTSAMSPEGLVGFALALIFLKVAHELGHGFAAVAYGCRVPVMGVAFMILTPLLYTDVSDAWRLPSRRKRLAISGAGIMVELAIATLASFVWVFLPDGALRSIAFYIATSAWVMSLAINLNPCMRFDGYYLFGDWLGVDNLQPRAFALARWKLRQWIVAPDLSAPERLPEKMKRLLLLYALVTWIYRLILFTTIALMVYHFAFKALGILLFCLEIGLLIVAPIVREILTWREIAPTLRSSRRMALSTGLVVAMLGLLIVPLPGRVSVPAILTSGDLAKLYATREGRISAVLAAPGDRVAKDATLLEIQSPKLESEIQMASIRGALMTAKLQGAMADPEKREDVGILNRELASLKTQRSGLIALKDELRVTAPLEGSVVQVAPDLHAGRWISKGAFLAIISGGQTHSVQGYITDQDRERLIPSAEGLFIPDDLGLASFPVKVEHLAQANSERLDLAELSSIQGGAIASKKSDDGGLVPDGTVYRIDLTPTAPIMAASHVIRGRVQLSAHAESYLLRALRQIAQILIRESGF